MAKKFIVPPGHVGYVDTYGKLACVRASEILHMYNDRSTKDATVLCTFRTKAKGCFRTMNSSEEFIAAWTKALGHLPSKASDPVEFGYMDLNIPPNMNPIEAVNAALQARFPGMAIRNLSDGIPEELKVEVIARLLSGLNSEPAPRAEGTSEVTREYLLQLWMNYAAPSDDMQTSALHEFDMYCHQHFKTLETAKEDSIVVYADEIEKMTAAAIAASATCKWRL